MKKIYQKPEMKAIEIKCEQFIAASGAFTLEIENRALDESEDWD